MFDMATMKCMDITFDPAKDRSNIAKHGVSLADAALLEWDEALIEIDSRRKYGQVREIAYVPMNERLYFVAFTRRNAALRIISLRKTNQREFDYYVSKIDPTN
jgi:uncharacterized DUF497 family protein